MLKKLIASITSLTILTACLSIPVGAIGGPVEAANSTMDQITWNVIYTHIYLYGPT